MALRIVVQVASGDLVAAVQSEVAHANTDLTRQVDFVSPAAGGGPDWAGLGAKLGKSAAGVAKMAGQMMRLAPQMILLTIGEWLLEGLLAKLQTPEGKGVADALALIGDAVLDLALTILPKLLAILMQVIAIYTPVVLQLVVLVHVVWPVVGPVLAFQWQIFQLWVDLQIKVVEGLVGLSTFVGGVVTYLAEKLTAAGAVFGRIIADIPGAIAQLLGDILTLVLAPLQTAMDAISRAWDGAQSVRSLPYRLVPPQRL